MAASKITYLKFIILLLMACKAYAQSDLVVNENFSNNERFWPIGKLDYATLSLQNNKYTIDRTLPEGQSVFVIDNYLDPKQNFSFETSFTIQKSDTGAFAGLVWNCGSEINYGLFAISADGRFQVTINFQGQLIDLSGLTRHEAIRKKGENTLMMKHSGDSCLYFINNVQVFATEYPGLGYTAHGLYAEKRMKVVATSFIVRQPQTISLTEEITAKKESLGPAVNSLLNDSAPVVSPDGSLLFFCREPQGAHNADIWVSTRTKEGTWSPAVNLGVPLNNKVFNSVISVSADNKSVLLLNTYSPDGSYHGCCFSISRFDGQHWSVPHDVNIENLNHYGFWLDASLSLDNRTLLLSALRKGGKGNNDLYVSFINEKGTWSEPLNLGASINTRFKEAGPFLAADNKTLYFSSVGYPGYGNQDIFMSRRLDDSWTNWSAPVNLGPAINSTGFDAFFSIAANDSTAYLVSNKKSVGGTDIFSLTLPKSLLPEKVCFLTGKVLDSKTKTPLKAKVEYRSLSNTKTAGSIVSDAATGAFQLVLPENGSYFLSAYRKEYFAQADSVYFSSASNQTAQKELIIYLDPLIIDKSVSIRQLYFEKAKAVLLPASIPTLDNLVYMLKLEPSIKIRIAGHTDNIGDAALNQQLSLERAESVRQYLLQQGITADRLNVEGFGGTKPIADNNKEDTRRLNRRVEFTVIEK